MRQNRDARIQILALSLIVLSFAFCVFVIALVTGLQETPASEVDHAGRAMGFNDRLSTEHYAIALRNFRLRYILNPESAYSLLLLMMHLCGGWLILSRPPTPNSQRLRRFFLAQAMIFPLGWVGIFVLPRTILSVFDGTLDREGIIDIPFIALTAQPAWIATAMFILFALGKDSRSMTDSGSEYASQPT